MKRYMGMLAPVILMLVAPALWAETVNGVLMDQRCSAQVATKGYAGAQAHTRACAMMPPCEASGYVVVTPEGKVLKFDAAGNKQAVAALKATTKKDDLTVTVEGTVSGENIAVQSLKIT